MSGPENQGLGNNNRNGAYKKIVAIVLKIQSRKPDSLKSSVSGARDWDIQIECPTRLNSRRGKFKTGLSQNQSQTCGQVGQSQPEVRNGPQYHNLDLLVRLIGHTNETNIIVDRSTVKV